ncbi:MAG: UDP-N-acetylglucosamine 2-epimerase (non-hydrolyzing) [Dehalococcoidia bacterium]|nr:UDP-N-acetylglucosamine 2-epimerase (non-hydrolyzing) [Dehalococcoidia bacterium]
MSPVRVLSVFGTRPEAVKMAPVVRALECDPRFESVVCVTAQHREMLDEVLDFFGIAPRYDLDVMRPDQTLADITTLVLQGLQAPLREARPDVVLVHGDTTTTLASTLAAFYAGVPVGHVEAGLRTGNLAAPFPEEGNRRLADGLTRFCFAPTETGACHLRAEGVTEDRIFVTGNTVIDALLDARARVAREGDRYASRLAARGWRQRPGRRVVLITAHRRESFGEGFVQICQAIRVLAEQHPDVDFVYPVHLNPNVRGPVETILAPASHRVHQESNLYLLDPLDYGTFVSLMDRCTLVLTDSGGIQEEAPSLGKPVLVMREVTERPEAVEAGIVELVGADRGRIVAGVERLLADRAHYQRMSQAQSPYGDGHAAERIVQTLAEALG